MMTPKEKEEFNKIDTVKKRIISLIEQEDNMFLPRQNGCGEGKYERCQWIDVRFTDNQYLAASILFYEDFRIDSQTGNLHPGRYGYVVFQRWNNAMIERKAPNQIITIDDLKGVFVPYDRKHRLETDICVLEDDITTISRQVFYEFVKFANQGRL